MSSLVRVLCIGDVVARDGRDVLQLYLTSQIKRNDFDLIIVNGENSAGGSGITPEIAEEFKSYGVDVVTSGDHVWQHKEFLPYLEKERDFCLRPANFPAETPGRGLVVKTNSTGLKFAVINLMGRVFMNAQVECPFRYADLLLADPILQGCAVIICDIHAEASSEKIALGRYLDGRVSIVFGTHTHVQTADENILPAGTAYITDLGMTGSTAGVIGMETETALKRFLTSRPWSYKAAKGRAAVAGIVVELDRKSGQAHKIERLNWSAE